MTINENIFDVLQKRDYIAQTIDEENLRKTLGEKKVKFYLGIDPTADSLHIGHS